MTTNGIITLRKATMDDRDFILSCRDDLKIGKAEHESWFARWIVRNYESSHEVLVVAEAVAVPVGIGRITIARLQVPVMLDTGCVVHYAIHPSSRKHGYGVELVKEMVQLAKAMDYSTVGAYIKRDNVASLKCALAGGVNAVGFI